MSDKDSELDGYDTKGSRFFGRIQRQILVQERKGLNPRRSMIALLPDEAGNSGIWRKIGNRTFYRLYGIEYQTKENSTTSGWNEAIARARSRILVFDGNYNTTSQITVKKSSIHIEGETSVEEGNPGGALGGAVIAPGGALGGGDVIQVADNINNIALRNLTIRGNVALTAAGLHLYTPANGNGHRAIDLDHVFINGTFGTYALLIDSLADATWGIVSIAAIIKAPYSAMRWNNVLAGGGLGNSWIDWLNLITQQGTDLLYFQNAAHIGIGYLQGSPQTGFTAVAGKALTVDNSELTVLVCDLEQFDTGFYLINGSGRLVVCSGFVVVLKGISTDSTNVRDCLFQHIGWAGSANGTTGTLFSSSSTGKGNRIVGGNLAGSAFATYLSSPFNGFTIQDLDGYSPQPWDATMKGGTLVLS